MIHACQREPSFVHVQVGHCVHEGGASLAIAFDDVNGYTRAVVEGGDLLGALVPSHRSGTIEGSLSEHDGLTGGHVETISKCFVIEWCNSLLVDV